MLLRLFENGEAEWARVDAAARLVEGPRRGLPSPEQVAGARLVVLAPGEQVLLTRARVPTRNPSRLRRALPYAVEDRLLGDADTQHAAAGTADGRDGVLAAVVERSRMRDWLGRLAKAGLQPDAMIPEPLALPRAEGSAGSVLLEDGRMLYRAGDGTGFAAETDWAADLLDDGEPKVVYRAPGAATAEAFSGTGAHQLDEPVLAWMARGLDPGIDLLQGDFRPVSRGGVGRLWRIAAALVLAWGVLELAFAGADYWRLARASDQLEMQITRVFQQTFPGARVVDARAQMAQHLAALGAPDGGALNLLRRVAPVLASRPGLSLESVEYRDGELTLSLRAGSLADLDSLRSALAGQGGLHAELASATASDKGVDGRLTISGTGA